MYNENVENIEEALSSCKYYCANHSSNDRYSFDPDKIEKAKKSLQELKKTLNQLVKFIIDTNHFYEDGMIKHRCEFDTNPEAGYCSVCDMWSNFMEENE